MKTSRISIIFTCLFLCAISLLNAPANHIKPSATCLAPKLKAVKEHTAGWKAKVIPDLWNIRLLALDYSNTISSAHSKSSISGSIKAMDSIIPDTWTKPFHGSITGEFRRFVFTVTLLNYIYSINPSVTIMVVSTGKTPFDTLFASRAVNEFQAYPALTRAYREGKFIIKERIENKTYEVRDTAYRNHVPQKNIVAIGDNPATDEGMALELGTYIELFAPESLPSDEQVDTPLTLILQSMLIKAVNSGVIEISRAA